MKFLLFSIFRLLSTLLLVSLLLAGQSIHPAYATTGYVVNTLNDDTTDDAFCTLREAILAANNAPVNANCGSGSNTNDTITFSVNGTITLGATLPNIVSGQGNLTIDGSGQNITISGNNLYRVIYVNSSANLTLRNLTIANGDVGSGSGGGIYNSGTLTLVDSTFANNSAGNGGGIFNWGMLNVTGSTFSTNSAVNGGGIFSDTGGTVTVTNSIFSGNSATTNGGGIYHQNIGTVIVTNSTFSANSASNGGGIYTGSGTLTVTNSTFSANSALYGGGIYNNNIGTLTMTNSTFSGNSAIAGSGGSGINNTGTATIKNTIIANSTGAGDCENTGTLSGNNNLIENSVSACGLSNGSNGNIIGVDPNLGTLTGSPAYFPLNPGSLAIDTGTNSGCPSTDQRGMARPQDGNGNGTATCDIGSYELTASAHYVVNTLNDDTTAGDGLCTLREAILAANYDGSYNSNSGCGPASSDNDSITFSVSGTIALVSTLPNIQDAATVGTLTIDGSGQNITISGDADNNGTGDVRVMRVNNGGNLTLRKLTVIKGRSSDGWAGGGVYNDGGTLTITNSTFSNNTSTSSGGAVRNNGTLTITNSIFSDNSANNNGGGVVNVGTLTVVGSTFSNNSASNGGGIHNDGPLTITGSTFSANNSTSNGGGIFHSNGVLDVANSTFSNNSADWGGGIYNSAATLNVSNSTFSANSAGFLDVSSRGGGIINNGGTMMVTNSTFSGNSAGYGGGIANYGTTTLKNTIIANNTEGGDCVGATLDASSINNLIESTGLAACDLTNGSNGNIIGVDPNLGTLTGSPAYFPLNPSSPAIDAGTNSGCPSTDQRGMARPQDGDGNGTATCDIGSYEASATVVTAVFRSIGSQDGWVLESSETSNQGGTFNSTATTFRLGDDPADRQYRAILSFNTASLPDTAIITRVTLKIRKQGLVGTNPFTILGGLRVDIRKPYFGSGAALAAGDFQAAASQNNIGSIPNTPVSGWYSKTWTSGAFFSYINRTGLTQFRLRFATDDNNDNGADYLAFYSGNATVSARPILIIQYYVP